MKEEGRGREVEGWCEEGGDLNHGTRRARAALSDWASRALEGKELGARGREGVGNQQQRRFGEDKVPPALVFNLLECPDIKFQSHAEGDY